MDYTKFFRRRQFLLGPKPAELPGWRTTAVTSGIVVTSHPDLPVTQASHAGGSITLLGFLIDPDAPDRSEQDTLEQLIKKARTLANVAEGINGLSGRFVLIVALPDALAVFHDAVALRQVNYCRDKQGRLWCASQPDALADQLGFKFDTEVLDFKALPGFKGKTEFWLLHNRTPYREVLNLLPNHYLDLETGQAVRYWPTPGCIRQLTIKESNDLCAPLLVNSIRAASHRFDLRMGVSAGIDSRKTLAATRSFSDKICYFSHGTTETTLDISDVSVPARLLPKLGLKHHALPLLPMPEDFKKLFDASCIWAREKKGKNAYTVLKNFGPDATVLNSNISEVAQCIYWLPKSKLSGEGLALLCGLAHPFAIREFDLWLQGAKPACDAARMDVLALFFLEQRMGRWATAAFSEYDIAHETFNPYNNRRLHCLMLGVDKKYRRDRKWTVSLEHIKSMWPEVLAEPINPQDSPWAKFQQFVRRSVVHKAIPFWFPIYPYLRFVKRERRFRKQQRANPVAVKVG